MYRSNFEQQSVGKMTPNKYFVRNLMYETQGYSNTSFHAMLSLKFAFLRAY